MAIWTCQFDCLHGVFVFVSMVVVAFGAVELSFVLYVPVWLIVVFYFLCGLDNLLSSGRQNFHYPLRAGARMCEA